MQRRYTWLPAALTVRYARAYGTRITTVLAHCTRMADLGPEIVPGLYAAEADYLMTQEWAHTAADILWRRSKLGLHVPEGSEQVLGEWMAAHHAA
jgi:glycerol-3-phosphate dehydrogenase